MNVQEDGLVRADNPTACLFCLLAVDFFPGLPHRGCSLPLPFYWRLLFSFSSSSSLLSLFSPSTLPDLVFSTSHPSTLPPSSYPRLLRSRRLHPLPLPSSLFKFFIFISKISLHLFTTLTHTHHGQIPHWPCHPGIHGLC